jgi:hypothetical protein
MNIMPSKTDALGDQVFASGYVRQILAQALPDVLVWFVRKGYEGVSTLFKGSRVFMQRHGIVLIGSEHILEDVFA